MTTLKNTWQNGEQYNASDANELATEVNGKYVKPGTGIPITDLSSGVQVSLGKADTAVQSVSASSISDSTATGRSVLTAADSSAARTAIGVAYGSTAGTVCQGNDSRLSPSSTTISDATTVGKAVLTATDAAAARTTLGVAYGSTSGTVAQGNDSRITGAEQTTNKGVANGYAGLDSGGKVALSTLATSTSAAVGVGSVELGHASDTTLTRSAAGKLAVEGVDVVLATGGQNVTLGTVTPESLNVSSVGYLGMPANSQSAAYTLVAADAGKMILHPSSDNNARTFTIPANSSVAFPVGTVVTFVNGINTVTVAITSDTLTLAGAGTTGSRTLAANGLATAIKTGSTSWLISGNGLT